MTKGSREALLPGTGAPARGVEKQAEKAVEQAVQQERQAAELAALGEGVSFQLQVMRDVFEKPGVKWEDPPHQSCRAWMDSNPVKFMDTKTDLERKVLEQGGVQGGVQVPAEDLEAFLAWKADLESTEPWEEVLQRVLDEVNGACPHCGRTG